MNRRDFFSRVLAFLGVHMTAALHHYTFLSIKANQEDRTFGSLTRPAIISCVGQVIERAYEIAVSTTKTIFDITNDLSSFETIAIASDFDLMLELGTDIGNQVGDEYYTVPLRGSGRANEMGPAFVLNRDDSYAGYTSNFGGGTLDLIEKIRARNLSSSQAAQVRLFGVR